MPQWTDHSAHRHRLLALALLALHVALVAAPDAPLRTPFVLVHFGLVLLWQPFWQGSTRVSAPVALATLGVGVAIVWWSSWLLLGAWLLVLLGLVGGELVATRRDQVAQWLVVLYLFIALLAGVTPPLFALGADAANVMHPLVLAAGLIPLALLPVGAGPIPGHGQRFDYLRSMTITLFTLLLSAGAVLWTYRSGTPYPTALVQALLFVAVLILAVNWIWRRRASHTMFQVLWNRYLLNLGTPFEHYLISLSGPAARGLEPDEYLGQALHALGELDWVAGVEVRGPAGDTVAGARVAGERTPHATEAHDDTAPLIVYTRRDPGPSLRLHIQLLARLVQQLYLSRLHEAELRNQAKARAVHETGARLTHDIKNLLQSLQSLSAAVGAAGPERAQEALGLVQRQVPYINQRLQSTLEKLREPASGDDGGRMPAAAWWEALQARYAGSTVEFAGELDDDVELPRELFDTVAENLLENARYKRATDREVRVHVDFRARAGALTLRVCDTGEPVPENLARHLFGGAVSSASGLGVGLYQCARLAQHHGFELRLERNEPGAVCFQLEGAAAQESGTGDRDSGDDGRESDI